MKGFVHNFFTAWVYLLVVPSPLRCALAAGICYKDSMDLTAYDVLRGLEQGHFTSEQLVSKYLARINETNDDLNAVYQISSKALQDARTRDSERKRGGDLGSLHGVPVLIKVGII